MRLELTTEEMQRLTDFSVSLIKSKKAYTIEKYKMDGRADGDARIRRNLEGYMAEYAVAKYLGVPFRDVITTSNDGNYDLEYEGVRIGVKGTRYAHGTLLVKLTEMAKKSKPDVYVLCVVDVDKSTVLVKGAKSTEYIAENIEPSFVRRDTPPVYRVMQPDLEDLNEILDKQKEVCYSGTHE